MYRFCIGFMRLHKISPTFRVNFAIALARPMHGNGLTLPALPPTALPCESGNKYWRLVAGLFRGLKSQRPQMTAAGIRRLCILQIQCVKRRATHDVSVATL